MLGWLERWNLRRFVRAQGPVFNEVVTELASGKKRGPWMPFIFPDALRLTEARLYAAHPLLGTRLRWCTDLMLSNLYDGWSAEDVLGEVDAMKFCASMTLFHDATGEAVFLEAIAVAGCLADG